MFNQKHRCARGYTLVELLVASLIGVVVVFLAVEMMLGAARVSRVQDGLAEVNQNGAFVFGFIRDEIQMAGYSGELFSDSLEPIYWKTTRDNGGLFDEITLQRRFFGKGDIDCLGETVPIHRHKKVVLSRYFVDLMPGEQGLYELRCEVSIIKNLGEAPSRLKSTALIAGVESFQVQYGVSARSSNGGYPEYIAPVAFIKADDVDPVHHAVTAIRFAFLLRSSNGAPLMKGARGVEEIQLLERHYDLSTPDIDLSDGVIRRGYQTTVALKNIYAPYPNYEKQ